MIEFVEKFEERLRKKYKGGSVSVDDVIALAIELKGETMTKDKWINIRCTEQERKDITEQAKANNMSVAEFFRYLVAKERKEREGEK